MGQKDIPMNSDQPIPRAIEVGFPIVEINRLAVPERNSFKPIYQMHKWFARRASCVFRAILLGALKPAFGPDGKPVDLKELQDAFERLAQRPVQWSGGKPLRDTLLDLYRTEAESGIEADVIYTFW